LCGGCRFFNYLDVKGLGECVRSNQNFTALNTGCLKWEKGK